MREITRQAFATCVVKYEGRTSWMYQDIKGLMTCGIGNLIDPISHALELPWRKAGGDRATHDEVREEWKRIKADTSLARKGAKAARKIATLHLPDEDIDALVGQKRDDFWETLARQFPASGAWPADAQMGLLLMAWALGPGFPKKWPNFSRACGAGDWRVAADECTISGARPERNHAHRTCFMNAASGADPERLYFPEETGQDVVPR